MKVEEYGKDNPETIVMLHGAFFVHTFGRQYSLSKEYHIVVPHIMGFGDNTRSALITRALVEMKRFVLAYGGTPETLSGLAGIGDLIVTCTSVHSRNHSVGERLGRGEKIDAILSSMQMVAEGVWNSKVVHSLAAKLGVDMPICNLVYALCYEGLDARQAVTMMMTRELKSE
jgi:glycerol-3-phosphate dehydrogenase (NAD(P)+)